MPHPTAALAAATAFALLLALASLAHAGQGVLPPSYPVTLGKIWDPTYTGPARGNASKQLMNEWTCRQTPGCASHYCGLPYVLSNSQGYFRCDPSNRVGRPTSLDQLRSQILAFSRVKANGVGHSWDGGQFCAGAGPSSLGVVLTEFPEVLKLYTTPPKQYKLTGCDPATARPFGGEDGQSPIIVDLASRTVKVHAGVGTRMLLDYIAACPTKLQGIEGVPDGWTLPAYPWYIDQTIGGAVATATHGSSFTYGSLSNQVVALQLMTADGEILDLSAADPDGGHLFRAARASVGRLGVLTSLTFNIVPQVPVERMKRRMTLEQMAAEVTAVQEAYNAVVTAGGTPAEIAAALAPLDNTQFFFFAKTNEAWRFDFRTLNKTDDAKAQTAVDVAAEAKRAVEEQGAFLLGAVSALLSKAGTDGKALFAAMAGRLDGKARTDPDVDKKAGLVPSKPLDLEKLEAHKGVPDAKVAAQTYAVGVKIDAATRLQNATLAEEGVYAQYDKSVALPPNAYWVADLFNSTFDAVMRSVQGANLVPGAWGSRKAFPSQACPQSVVLADSNAYDQYEAAIPFSKAGTCLAALVDLLNGPAAARLGFRTTPLVRFVGGDDAYISMTHGGPRMFINLEDHLSYDTGPHDGSGSDSAAAQNPGFWAVMELLVHGPACGGRLHWGKAGWPTLLPDWDPVDAVTGYPDTWCDFGCAVAALDPGGKFRTSSPVWRWNFEVGGSPASAAQCCGPSGFNATACACAPPPPPPPP